MSSESDMQDDTTSEGGYIPTSRDIELGTMRQRSRSKASRVAPENTIESDSTVPTLRVADDVVGDASFDTNRPRL